MKILFWAILFMLLGHPALLRAEGEFSGSLGYAAPLGDMRTVVDKGIQAGGSLGYLVGSQVVVGAEFRWTRYGHSPEYGRYVNEVLGSHGEVDVTSIQVGAFLKVLAQPYQKGVYGRWNVSRYTITAKASQSGLSNSISSSDPGFGLGLGYMFRDGFHHFGFVEVVHNTVLTEDSVSAFVDIRAGVKALF